MAKIRASEVRHGPIRWLTRIAGWFMFLGGIASLFVDSDMLTIYLGGGGTGPIMMGAFLIFLDILVGITDPEKKPRKKTASYTPGYARSYTPVTGAKTGMEDLEKMYQAVYAATSNAHNLPKLITQYTTDQLTRKVRESEDFCQMLFLTNPSQDVLSFIHTYNRVASYRICLEVLKAFQKQQAGGTGPNSGK